MALNLKTHFPIDEDVTKSPNLCERFSEEDLSAIGLEVWEGYTKDKDSRFRWEKRMEAGMDLAMQVQKDKSFPWPGCSNVIFPLITIAALQFSARSYSNIIHGTDVVRYRVIGEDPQGALRQRADRISKHMSWQVLEEDIGWEEQHDRMLINLGIVGCNFIKTYFSPSLGYTVSELVLARDLVLDYYAKSVEACARKTHVVPLYRNEIYERVKSGIFTDVLEETWFVAPPPLSEPNPKVDTRSGLSQPQSDSDTPFRTLEQHRLLDLDNDGYAEPYIVTIEESSKKVLRIVARWDTDEEIERTEDGTILRIRPVEYFTKYSFIPAPDGGIYDVGFGVLLGPLNESVNSGINQLLDAGTMQNSMGGFLGRGAKIRGGVYSMAPWEWKRVDSTGDDLRKSMVPFPERAPSDVMFKLLGLLINYTDRIAGTVDQMVGENPGQNTPAETSRNMTEQGMQVYSMIFKRVWRAMKEEFKKRHKLNGTYMPLRMRFGASGGLEARREDYKSNPDMVVPVADPNITSTATRVQQAAIVRQSAHEVQGYNVPEVEKRWLNALRVEGIEQVYPGPDKVPPLPNPKAQIEQMKASVQQMKIEFEKWKFAHEMMEQKKLNAATIEKLRADAAKVLSEVGVAKAGAVTAAFDSAIAAVEKQNEAIDRRMELMMGGKEGEEGKSERGGVPGMAQPPGNAGVPGVPPPMGGGPAPAMGGGGIPGGGG